MTSTTKQMRPNGKGDERPRAGMGFLGRSGKSPPHQLRGVGSAVSSFSRVRCGAAADKMVSYIEVL